MNIGSYSTAPAHRFEPNRIYVLVPIPEDYTEEERKYAQEELVRLTYLSMYKIIDKIGLDRENESQRLREAEQEEARREAARASRNRDSAGEGREDSRSGRLLYSGPNGDHTVPASQEAPQAPSQEGEADDCHPWYGW